MINKIIETINTKGINSKDIKYLFCIPRIRKAYIGFGSHKTIEIYRDGINVITENESIFLNKKIHDPFETVNNLLAPSLASLWLVSSDFCRPTQDIDLPLLKCIQADDEIELDLTGEANNFPILDGDYQNQSWISESDEIFLERLTNAINALQAHPDGKIIVTRTYTKQTSAISPLRLFEIFCSREPNAACWHYVQISDETTSIGCSPENIFEFENGRLTFDVVAGTRGKSSNPEKDSRWRDDLLNDPKEIREHMLAYRRYLTRLDKLIEPGSLRIEINKQILDLGKVRHIISRVSGQPSEKLGAIDLIKQSFPPLHSYPESLLNFGENLANPNRFYGGMIGRMSAHGSSTRFFLNIRSVLKKNNSLYTQGGVGVIAESEARKELLEVKNKLGGLFNAIETWEAENYKTDQHGYPDQR